jgi:hypothetical protein
MNLLEVSKGIVEWNGRHPYGIGVTPIGQDTVLVQVVVNVSASVFEVER